MVKGVRIVTQILVSYAVELYKRSTVPHTCSMIMLAKHWGPFIQGGER